jgi:hypothetical protein
MSTDIQAARFAALRGRIGVLLLISGLLASCGVSIPQMVAGQVSTDHAGSTRPLTASEVATVSDWLAQHRYGWKPNFVTSPAGTLYISLDTASQRSAVRLTFWPGPKYPGWNGTVLLELSPHTPQQTILVQSFADYDLAPDLRLFTP